MPPTVSPPNRRPGRPRDPGTDDAILQAAVDLISEEGLAGTTVAAVAARAGVSRATVYLRWPNTAALAGAAARAAVGGFPFQVSGDLERDIVEGAEFMRRSMAALRFRTIFPELVAAVLAEPPVIEFAEVVPARSKLADAYRRSAGEQGFDPAADPDLAFDLLLGAQLVQLLATGAASTPAYAAELGRAVVAALRSPERGGTAGENRSSGR